jgi:Glycerol uptake facilitator and related permeases (Major Intrinsic Protein Family)
VEKYVAEFVGTLLLVFFGVGSAVFGLDAVGALGVALAFGLTLLALVYVIGPVSGCHVNPAVTLGALMTRRISATDAVGYWVGQVAEASSARPCCGVSSNGAAPQTSPRSWAPTVTPGPPTWAAP